MQGDRVWTALRYDAASSTEIRSRLRLRSTVPGANNRLDIQQIVSWDREEGQALPMMGARGWVVGLGRARGRGGGAGRGAAQGGASLLLAGPPCQCMRCGM